jgi:NCS1 family nucleobase:cation symporter-1
MPLSKIEIDVKEFGKDIKAKATSLKAWELLKQTSSVAPEYVWSNIDQDPVPLERQNWGAWTFIGYWFSDLADM